VLNNEKLATETLLKFFGFAGFRPGQLEIVLAILDELDILAILPTGGGKSLCFQVPALIFPGTSLVISPLISLMKDQVDHLEKAGVSATYLSSNLSREEIDKRLTKLSNGEYKLFYLAPERLENKKIIEICQQINISYLVVDEAHCISLWGHQFRPSYQKIPEFIEKIQKNNKKIAIAAFTATATSLVCEEIKKFLKLQKPTIFSGGFLRKNLIFHNLVCEDNWTKNTYLFKLLKDHQTENIIIYCSTRIECERLFKLIKFYDFRNIYELDIYHGGLEKNKREQSQNKFLSGQTKIMIATNAFGMGVDKSDIRIVIHYQISANLENYYQEAGRAGRDGKMSFVYLLYSEKDLLIQAAMINNSYEDLENQRRQIEIDKLSTIKKYALSKTCLQTKIINYFGQNNKESSCKNCYNCLKIKIELNELEKEFVKKLEIINQKYLDKINCKNLPNLFTIRQMELMAILEPKNISDLRKIPGVGSDIIYFYANQRIGS
jgi:ATP-dependent DNA helicase RecQ